MSLLPLMLGATPHSLMDRELNLSLTPEHILHAAHPLVFRDYYRPWRQVIAPRDQGTSIKSTKDKFEIKLDVEHFLPEEITVKTGDGYVIIEGKHEEKKDEHGFVARQFTRRYALPEKCNTSTVESKLSSDGVLIVTAPKVLPSAKDERSVTIVPTGPVRKVVKEAIDHAENQTDTNGAEK